MFGPPRMRHERVVVRQWGMWDSSLMKSLMWSAPAFVSGKFWVGDSFCVPCQRSSKLRPVLLTSPGILPWARGRIRSKQTALWQPIVPREKKLGGNYYAIFGRFLNTLPLCIPGLWHRLYGESLNPDLNKTYMLRSPLSMQMLHYNYSRFCYMSKLLWKYL